jgi:hypothetical protein
MLYSGTRAKKLEIYSDEGRIEEKIRCRSWNNRYALTRGIKII